MMQQYFKLKADHPDAGFLPHGRLYELFLAMPKKSRACWTSR
jgi:DNA mismatch repair ATPase MutS